MGKNKFKYPHPRHDERKIPRDRLNIEAFRNHSGVIHGFRIILLFRHEQGTKLIRSNNSLAKQQGCT
jgi:hypothetical protein